MLYRWNMPPDPAGGPHPTLSWPVCIVAAALISVLGASRERETHPETTLGRAVGSIWMGLGISMVLFPALGISRHLTDFHTFIAVIAAFLGMANGASALMLRWKMQFACALGWWATSIASALSGQECLCSSI